MSDEENTTELLDEEALRRALRPERAEAEHFRAGVRRRLAELEERRGAERARFQAAPERLRWVASILPPGILPGAAAAAGLAGKKLSLKAAPGLLALPAVSVAMVVLSAGGAFLALSRQSAGAHDGKRTAADVQAAWWRRNRVPAIVTLALLILLAWSRHSETAVVLVLASIAATTFLVGELARAGLSDRRTVGGTLARLLWTMGLNWYLLRYLLPGDPSGLGPAVGPGLLILGSGACLVSGRAVTWSRVREWLANPVRMGHPDALTTWCLRAIAWPLVLCATVFALAFLSHALARLVPFQPSRERIASWVGDFDPADRDAEWVTLESALELLATDGGPAPDLTSLRAAFASSLGELRQRTWLSGVAARFELLDRATLDRWVGPEPRVLDAERPLRGLYTSLADVYVLEALGRLSAADRDALAERVAAVRPDPGKFDALSRMQRKAELLELLGRPDLAKRQRDDVLALLERCWIGTHAPSGAILGFAVTPEAAARARPFFAGELAARLSSVGTTRAALDLMRRYGVPASIRMAGVRNALVHVARFNWFEELIGAEPQRTLAEIALLELDRMAPEARPGALGWLAARRVILAALLLSVLCVVATLRAPRPEGRA